MLDNERLNEMSADECFAYMKSKKQNITHDGLDEIADTCLELINKYRTTGQVQGMRKLIFHYENIEREHQLVNLGINTFVYN